MNPCLALTVNSRVKEEDIMLLLQESDAQGCCRGQPILPLLFLDVWFYAGDFYNVVTAAQKCTKKIICV